MPAKEDVVVPLVAVVGAVNVDIVVTASRLPGPGETVVGHHVRQCGGGKGANAAVAAARAGARVRFIGAVGDDDLGRNALAELTAEGVDVTAVVTGDSPTGVALIVVDDTGENQIAVGAGANDCVDDDQVRTHLRSCGAELGLVLVSTEIPGAAVSAAVRTAAELGVPCVLNPAPVVPAVVDVLKYRPVLTPNAGELGTLASMVQATAIAREPQDARSLDPAARAPLGLACALAHHAESAVVVTLGSEGVLLVDSDLTQHIGPRPTAVLDTTGAGDTFNGVLAARMAGGDDLRTAAQAANAAAAISVAAIGARAGMPGAAAIEFALQATSR